MTRSWGSLPLRRWSRAWRSWLATGLLVASVAPLLSAQPRSPVIQQRVRLDPSEPVGFRVLLTPDTVFIGQQVTYEIGVFITESAQQRMRRNPEVVPAELRGVLAYDLGGPQSLPAIMQNGTRSFPHVLQRALFPLAQGQLEIPASQLTYTLPRTTSFFSREESVTMRADDLTLHVKPLPRTGQPVDFTGAVGVIGLRATVDSAAARVGEPVLLTVRLSGRGNVKLWPRPAVATPGATLVPAGERVRVDTSGQFVRGTKDFDWLVTPEQQGALSVPVIQYAYFDPYDAAYRTATTEPIGITIAAGEFVSAAPSVAERDGLVLRREDRGPQPRPWSRHPLLWALLLAAPLPALLRRRASTAADTERERAAQSDGPRPVASPALTENDRSRRAAAVARKELLDALAVQLDTSPAALLAQAALARRLRRRGVTKRTTEQVVALAADLDAAAWARDAAALWRDEPALRARSEALLAQVTLEAIPAARAAAPASRISQGAPLGSVLMLLGALTVSATMLSARSAPPDAFAAGVSAFDEQQYAAAARDFASILAESPRHADAWANAGTAAWAAGDTVAAVRGWQRALRLEPMARDVRRHLALLPTGSREGIAHVPHVPPNAGTIGAAILWCLGWVGIAWRRFSPDHPLAQQLRMVPLAVLAASLAVGLWQFGVEQRLAGRRLAVVARAEPMHVAPGRDANVLGGTAAGDLVRRDEERADGASGEPWARVTHADGRIGWILASALVAIEGATP